MVNVTKWSCLVFVGHWRTLWPGKHRCPSSRIINSIFWWSTFHIFLSSRFWSDLRFTSALPQSLFRARKAPPWHMLPVESFLAQTQTLGRPQQELCGSTSASSFQNLYFTWRALHRCPVWIPQILAQNFLFFFLYKCVAPDYKHTGTAVTV